MCKVEIEEAASGLSPFLWVAFCGDRGGTLKDYAKAFYKSAAWKQTSAAYKKSVGGLCERCRTKGLIVPGVIVHHKIYITPDNINDPSVTLDWHNLECVCRNCHAEEHTGVVKRFAVDALGRVSAV